MEKRLWVPLLGFAVVVTVFGGNPNPLDGVGC